MGPGIGSVLGEEVLGDAFDFAAIESVVRGLNPLRTTQLQLWLSGKIVVNCGSAHSEKTAYMKVGDNGGNWVGVRLTAKYGARVWSGDFMPVRGNLPRAGYDGTCYDEDNYRDADENGAHKNKDPVNRVYDPE